ncbi:uncharacterized protein METZ01_LOCUS239075 [marine metagenome]|uniref:Uncharacterized protein n=1 Tax=marine metagenome TaxID=408172 RepID=A0A382HIA3_9ZZZZ
MMSIKTSGLKWGSRKSKIIYYGEVLYTMVNILDFQLEQR